jgi:hypothetical protein
MRAAYQRAPALGHARARALAGPCARAAPRDLLVSINTLGPIAIALATLSSDVGET